MKTIKIVLTALTVLLIGGAAFAQGEDLFKRKCSTCHAVDQKLTGPALKGVKQKWTDAGESEMLYEWVMNSKGLISSGKSKMATAIQGFSASEMPAQQVSKEDIDAIFTYVDTYVEAPKVEPPAGGTSVDGTTPQENITWLPDYESNLTLFYWLLAFMVILLFTIIIMANTILTFVRSDFFKNKLKEQENSNGGGGKNLLGLILLVTALGAMAMGNNSYAMQFVNAGETTEKTPWLLVENMDLYLMLTADLILVFVVLYLRSLFISFLRMVKPEQVKEKRKATKKITKVLTDTVAVEDEESILMDHEYDGIRELDNNLPPWWVWGFYITIAFSVIYILNYHFFKTSDLQEVAYKKEMAKAEKDVKAYLEKMAMNVDETNATLLNDADAISQGKSIFGANCASCHKPNGSGDIGPNLTDKFWLYGNDIKDVFSSVKNGRPNGMPDHATKLTPVQIQQVASFVLQLPYKAGKAPEGKEVK